MPSTGNTAQAMIALLQGPAPATRCARATMAAISPSAAPRRAVTERTNAARSCLKSPQGANEVDRGDADDGGDNGAENAMSRE